MDWGLDGVLLVFEESGVFSVFNLDCSLLSNANFLCWSAFCLHADLVGVGPLSPLSPQFPGPSFHPVPLSPGPQVRTLGWFGMKIPSNNPIMIVRTWDWASLLSSALALCYPALLCAEGWGSPLPVSSQEPSGGVCEGWGSPLPGVLRLAVGMGVEVVSVEGWGSPLPGVFGLAEVVGVEVGAEAGVLRLIGAKVFVF